MKCELQLIIWQRCVTKTFSDQLDVWDGLPVYLNVACCQVHRSIGRSDGNVQRNHAKFAESGTQYGE